MALLFWGLWIVLLLWAQSSMGRLNAIRPLGECSGLPSLLDAGATATQRTYRPLLQKSMGIFAPGLVIWSLEAHVDASAGPLVQALSVFNFHPPLPTLSSLLQDSKSPAPLRGTWKALPAP